MKPKPMRCAMAFIDPITAVHTAIEIIRQGQPGRAPSPEQAEIARLYNEALRAAVAIARQSPDPIEALERLSAAITEIP